MADDEFGAISCFFFLFDLLLLAPAVIGHVL